MKVAVKAARWASHDRLVPIRWRMVIEQLGVGCLVGPAVTLTYLVRYHRGKHCQGFYGLLLNYHAF